MEIIQSGMHIEGEYGEYEIRCTHKYEGFLTIIKPLLVKVKEIPELTLWTISRLAVPHSGHENQLLYDIQLINMVIQTGK